MRTRKNQVMKVFLSVAVGLIVGVLVGETARVYAACYDTSTCYSHQANVGCVNCSPSSHYCGYEYVFDAPGTYVSNGSTYGNWGHDDVDEPCFTKTRCHLKSPTEYCSDGDKKCEIDPNYTPIEYKVANENILAGSC